MGQEEQKIAQLIWNIANSDKSPLSTPVMSGVVKSVDEDSMEAVVLLTVDDEDAPTEGITLNVILENKAGIYCIPAEQSNCIVCEVDGSGKWELLKASSYTKIVMNGGANGGLVKVQDLVQRINTLESDLNKLKKVFSTTWMPVANDGGAALKTAATDWSSAILTETQRDDIENEKVKH
jgi:hypothetical protein